jgi:hypothetical protein
MKAKARSIVGDLADWGLPALDGRMESLVQEIQKKKLTLTLDEDTLGEQLYAQLFDRVRKLGATAANEAITGWLEGVADGCPELCVEFPFVRGDASAAPLTVAYSVGARDGSRAELNRVDLEEALMEAIAVGDAGPVRTDRAVSIGLRLRNLAERLENSADKYK